MRPDSLELKPVSHGNWKLDIQRESKQLTVAAGLVVFTLTAILPFGAFPGDLSDSDVSSIGVRSKQAAYFAEFVAPAERRLHETVLNGLITGARPKLGDDFLRELRSMQSGEGTIFIWDKALRDTRVVAHLDQYIMLVLPEVLTIGERRSLRFHGDSPASRDIYAIYVSSEIPWMPLFSCVGLAIEGVVTLEKISSQEIRANFDLSFAVVEAEEWKSSDFCDDYYTDMATTFVDGSQ